MKAPLSIIDPEAMVTAKELFAMVRQLGALGLHAEAQAIQERANQFWLSAYGRTPVAIVGA